MSLKSGSACAALTILLLSVATASLAAVDSWISFRSRNLLVIGNTGEKDLRQVGIRLEQFRQVVSQAFPAVGKDSPVPTTVIVFKDDVSYGPFKVSQNNAGFFQPGRDVNYITLSNESRGDQSQINIMFHEYSHLLVNNSFGSSPAWFNEGLAELYSTLQIKSDGHAIIGLPIGRHINTLHTHPFLPLRTLLNIDYKSRYYNEIDKLSIFYAESWALLHFLMLNNRGERADDVVRFLQLLRDETPMDQAFQKAFGTSIESMEVELRSYIEQEKYKFTASTFAKKFVPDLVMESATVSEAQMQAYLGDLLFHSNRVEAEVYLRKALDVDPNLLLANESLGMLRFKQERVGDALKYLGRAIAKESKNALVHYYYASAVCRPGQEDARLSLGYSPEVATRVRLALRKAMSLRPDMLESYNLLAYVNLVTSSEIDETTALLERVLAQSPDRIDLVYMLGQLYMHRDDYKRARPLLERVSASSVEPDVKRHTQMLLTTMTSIETQQAEREAARRARGLAPNHSETETGDASNQVIDDPSMSLREALRIPAQGEIQTQGMLVSIECEKNGLIFIVMAKGRTLRLRTNDFQDIKRITFTADVQGSLTCGARKPGNHVIVCYVPFQKNQAKFDGMLKSVEFVPPDFKLSYSAP